MTQKMIKKKDLANWLIDYLTNTIHSVQVEEGEENSEFVKWAKNFQREEAAFVVNMEFVNDWGYDERKEIPEEEAWQYAQPLLQTIFDNWYL